MVDDQTQIRALIERWAKAVHGGDLDGVVADHADDIVMFNVPPPNDRVRGIDAYRATRTPFSAGSYRGQFRDRLDRGHRGSRCCIARPSS
jgi:ketosteroid isomerase-like protein